MGKGKRLKYKRRSDKKKTVLPISDSLTKNFQKQIRNSEIWDQMVEQFGEERAEQILKECKAEAKAGD